MDKEASASPPGIPPESSTPTLAARPLVPALTSYPPLVFFSVSFTSINATSSSSLDKSDQSSIPLSASPAATQAHSHQLALESAPQLTSYATTQLNSTSDEAQDPSSPHDDLPPILELGPSWPLPEVNTSHPQLVTVLSAKTPRPARSEKEANKKEYLTLPDRRKIASKVSINCFKTNPQNYVSVPEKQANDDQNQPPSSYHNIKKEFRLKDPLPIVPPLKPVGRLLVVTVARNHESTRNNNKIPRCSPHSSIDWQQPPQQKPVINSRFGIPPSLESRIVQSQPTAPPVVTKSQKATSKETAETSPVKQGSLSQFDSPAPDASSVKDSGCRKQKECDRNPFGTDEPAYIHDYSQTQSSSLPLCPTIQESPAESKQNKISSLVGLPKLSVVKDLVEREKAVPIEMPLSSPAPTSLFSTVRDILKKHRMVNSITDLEDHQDLSTPNSPCVLPIEEDEEIVINNIMKKLTSDVMILVHGENIEDTNNQTKTITDARLTLDPVQTRSNRSSNVGPGLEVDGTPYNNNLEMLLSLADPEGGPECTETIDEKLSVDESMESADTDTGADNAEVQELFEEVDEKANEDFEREAAESCGYTYLPKNKYDGTSRPQPFIKAHGRMDSKEACETLGSLYIACPPECPMKDCMGKVLRGKDAKLKWIQTEDYFGLAAAEDIRGIRRNGSQIMKIAEYKGIVYTKTSWKAFLRKKKLTKSDYGRYVVKLNGRLIDPEEEGNCLRLSNHSCKPNSMLQTWWLDGQYRLFQFPTEDIPSGKEIFWYYGKQYYGKDMIGDVIGQIGCKCKTVECEGVVGGKYDRAPKPKLSKKQKLEKRKRERDEEKELLHFKEEQRKKIKLDLAANGQKEREERSRKRLER